MYDNTGYTVTDANGDKEFILNDSCDKAYHWNLSFLVVQYASVAIVVLLLGIAFSAERIRRRYPLQNPFPPLTGTTVPCVISAVVLAAYAVMVVSKADASIVNLSIMKDNLAANNGFPFAQGSVDICTVMLIVATMCVASSLLAPPPLTFSLSYPSSSLLRSVIRGTTRGSTSAFRLASVASILHIALVYPIVVGNYEVMDYNSMWTRGDYYGPDASGGLSHIFGTGCRGFWATYYLSYYNDPSTCAARERSERREQVLPHLPCRRHPNLSLSTLCERALGGEGFYGRGGDRAKRGSEAARFRRSGARSAREQSVRKQGPAATRVPRLASSGGRVRRVLRAGGLPPLQPHRMPDPAAEERPFSRAPSSPIACPPPLSYTRS
jgi:hypothetical protein